MTQPCSHVNVTLEEEEEKKKKTFLFFFFSHPLAWGGVSPCSSKRHTRTIKWEAGGQVIANRAGCPARRKPAGWHTGTADGQTETRRRRRRRYVLGVRAGSPPHTHTACVHTEASQSYRILTDRNILEKKNKKNKQPEKARGRRRTLDLKGKACRDTGCSSRSLLKVTIEEVQDFTVRNLSSLMTLVAAPASPHLLMLGERQVGASGMHGMESSHHQTVLCVFNQKSFHKTNVSVCHCIMPVVRALCLPTTNTHTHTLAILV